MRGADRPAPSSRTDSVHSVSPRCSCTSTWPASGLPAAARGCGRFDAVGRRHCAAAAPRSRAPGRPAAAAGRPARHARSRPAPACRNRAATSSASPASMRVDRSPGAAIAARGRCSPVRLLSEATLLSRSSSGSGSASSAVPRSPPAPPPWRMRSQLALELVGLAGERLQAQRGGIALDGMHAAARLVDALEDGGLALRGRRAAQHVVDLQQAGLGARDELAQHRRVGVDRLEQHLEFLLRALALALQLALQLDARRDVLHRHQQVAHRAAFLHPVEVEGQVAERVLAQAVLHQRLPPPTAG